jgi:hypothetical protein
MLKLGGLGSEWVSFVLIPANALLRTARRQGHESTTGPSLARLLARNTAQLNEPYTLILELATIPCRLKALNQHSCKLTSSMVRRDVRSRVLWMVFLGVAKCKSSQQRHKMAGSPHHITVWRQRVSSLARKQHTSLAYVDLEGE